MSAPRSVPAPALAPVRAQTRHRHRRLERLVRRLSRPRRVGTPGERRACGLVLNAFREAGLTVYRESFWVPWTGRALGVRLVLTLTALLVWLALGPLAARPVLAAACGLAVALLAHAPWSLASGLGKRFPTHLRSRNLIGRRRPGQPTATRARVVFMAHHDSKSQTLPTGVRVAVVSIVAIGGLSLALIRLLDALTIAVPASAANVVGLVLFTALGLLALNRTGNGSPGAIDNASGLAALLELARGWRPRADPPIEVLFVATGAEEIGLDGARAFLDRHDAWLRHQPTLILNLDSLGAGDRILLAGDPHSLELAEAVALDQQIETSRLRVIGAGMDHEPFARAGIPALSLLGDVVGESLRLHTRRDTIEHVDLGNLERGRRLAAAIAHAWAAQFAVASSTYDPIPEQPTIVASVTTGA